MSERLERINESKITFQIAQGDEDNGFGVDIIVTAGKTRIIIGTLFPDGSSLSSSFRLIINKDKLWELYAVKKVKEGK